MVTDPSAYRVLIFTPFGKDGSHLLKVLKTENVEAFCCQNLEQLLLEIRKGVGLIVITEEVILSRDAKGLAAILSDQEAWSAVPVVVFYSVGSPLLALKPADRPGWENAIYLQRPTAAATIFSAVRSALRDRARQYKMRDLLSSLKKDVENQTNYGIEQEVERIKSDQAKQEAIEASQVKSQFLANMSHEIRTPLGAIMGFLELIKSPDISKEETAEYISIVNRNSQQLMRLIDDILDLSKVEAGKMDFENTEFSLGEFLFDFSSMMSFKAHEKGVRFDLSLVSDLPARISSDSTRLRQVLLNAVGNAIKFTDRGTVKVECSFADSTLKFLVMDTGRGISPDQAERLFQPFIQADSSTTRKYGGTGLGLVLSKKICQVMGGDFKLVRSALDQGSSFEATMKVQVPAGVKYLGQSNLKTSPLSEPLLNKPNLLHDVRILLVDDMRDNQTLANIILKKLGARTDTVSNGREALEMAARNAYDIILMDIQMPVMDGHEATRALRSRGCPTPIIALTAHAMKEERELAEASGFTDYLSKPIQRELLIETLMRYVH